MPTDLELLQSPRGRKKHHLRSVHGTNTRLNRWSFKATRPIRRRLAASAVRNLQQKNEDLDASFEDYDAAYNFYRLCIDYKLKKFEEMSGFVNRVFGIMIDVIKTKAIRKNDAHLLDQTFIGLIFTELDKLKDKVTKFIA